MHPLLTEHRYVELFYFGPQNSTTKYEEEDGLLLY